LRAASEAVCQPLTAGQLGLARSTLNLYVGRDRKPQRPEILRAVLETVTENATDGVMAPLFYAIRAVVPVVGSVPLALAYKAKYLDSMVG